MSGPWAENAARHKEGTLSGCLKGEFQHFASIFFGVTHVFQKVELDKFRVRLPNLK
jgi:hypothetical protein